MTNLTITNGIFTCPETPPEKYADDISLNRTILDIHSEVLRTSKTHQTFDTFFGRLRFNSGPRKGPSGTTRDLSGVPLQLLGRLIKY